MHFAAPIAWLTMSFFVLTVAGCARRDWIDQTLVTVDVTGMWKGKFTTWSSGDLELSLQQSGPKVTGDIMIRGGNLRANGPIRGSVNGDMFRFQDERGQVIGELQVNGDEMVGSGTAAIGGMSSPIRIELHRQQ